MLFDSKNEVTIVKNCPVSKASAGVIEFSPELVAKIAGAVYDNIEWMVLLLGERSADGFHVKVTDFRVPKQRRSGGDVKMAEPMEGDGSTVDDAVIGVLHSHHRMGAFFSGTDNTELNPFFKSSIVVAQAKTALGFSYKAEMKVVLPCGSVGKVDAFLKVTGSERWNAVEKHEVDGKQGFGDCDQLTEEVENTETETITRRKTPAICDLSSELKTERAFVFGQGGGDTLLKEIEAQSVHRAPDEKIFGGGNNGYNHRNGGGYDEPGKLSRRERRRLRREDKFSARKDGTHSLGSSAIDTCEHGVLLTVDCQGCNAEGDGLCNRDLSEYAANRRFVPRQDGDWDAPHRRATGVMSNSRKITCEFDVMNPPAHDRSKLYMAVASHKRWSIWLCEECYDWWEDGAKEAFEGDIDQSKAEECSHGVSLMVSCSECADDTPPKLITDGAAKWETVARDVLTADEYNAAKKERVERMLSEVSEKEARAKVVQFPGTSETLDLRRKEEMAKAQKVSERLGIISGNVH